jgi:hypothetical protein
VDTVAYEVPGPGRLAVDVAAADPWAGVLTGLALLVVGYLALPFGGVRARPEEDE